MSFEFPSLRVFDEGWQAIEMLAWEVSRGTVPLPPDLLVTLASFPAEGSVDACASTLAEWLVNTLAHSNIGSVCPGLWTAVAQEHMDCKGGVLLDGRLVQRLQEGADSVDDALVAGATLAPLLAGHVSALDPRDQLPKIGRAEEVHVPWACACAVFKALSRAWEPAAKLVQRILDTHLAAMREELGSRCLVRNPLALARLCGVWFPSGAHSEQYTMRAVFQRLLVAMQVRPHSSGTVASLAAGSLIDSLNKECCLEACTADSSFAAETSADEETLVATLAALFGVTVGAVRTQLRRDPVARHVLVPHPRSGWNLPCCVHKALDNAPLRRGLLVAQAAARRVPSAVRSALAARSAMVSVFRFAYRPQVTLTHLSALLQALGVTSPSQQTGTLMKVVCTAVWLCQEHLGRPASCGACQHPATAPCDVIRAVSRFVYDNTLWDVPLPLSRWAMGCTDAPASSARNGSPDVVHIDVDDDDDDDDVEVDVETVEGPVGGDEPAVEQTVTPSPCEQWTLRMLPLVRRRHTQEWCKSKQAASVFRRVSCHRAQHRTDWTCPGDGSIDQDAVLFRVPLHLLCSDRVRLRVLLGGRDDAQIRDAPSEEGFNVWRAMVVECFLFSQRLDGLGLAALGLVQACAVSMWEQRWEAEEAPSPVEGRCCVCLEEGQGPFVESTCGLSGHWVCRPCAARHILVHARDVLGLAQDPEDTLRASQWACGKETEKTVSVQVWSASPCPMPACPGIMLTSAKLFDGTRPPSLPPAVVREAGRVNLGASGGRPNCGVCGATVWAAPLSSGDMMVACAVCSMKTCVRCGDAAHEGSLCRALWPITATELLNIVKAQKCPGCARPTTKWKDCNHMHCVCGQHWCWGCGKAIGRTTDHYRDVNPAAIPRIPLQADAPAAADAAADADADAAAGDGDGDALVLPPLLPPAGGQCTMFVYNLMTETKRMQTALEAIRDEAAGRKDDGTAAAAEEAMKMLHTVHTQTLDDL